MKIFQCSILSLEHKQKLFYLWNLEYPVRICYPEISEFENYLKGLSNQKHFLLVDDKNQILGWAFTFIRESENWFVIILNSKIQRKGYGRLLLEELKNNNTVLSAWVIDHSTDLKQNNECYVSPLGFYIKNGFLVNQNIRLENHKISAVKISWVKELR